MAAMLQPLVLGILRSVYTTVERLYIYIDRYIEFGIKGMDMSRARLKYIVIFVQG